MSLNQSVWDGQINVRVVYGDSEFLLYIHRNSYFPLHYPEIANFFDSVVNHDLHLCPIWLEHEDVPIKWNLPAGVLYDLLYLPANSDKRHQWTLRLGIDTPESPYPSRDIIPFSISDGSIDYFSMLSQVIVNQLKQSTFVMNGNAKAMMSLSEQDSKSLWKSISQHDYNGPPGSESPCESLCGGYSGYDSGSNIAFNGRESNDFERLVAEMGTIHLQQ
ncbi:hypothetical protein CXQ85_001149 [Candidozyma haemuli]|uniref:Uncharacterized protein n=1 Tax=Candidozyma haemuli TaxID=45357 RepID=A0A2V1ALT7_9ASCO|nr:hypothetical protein CXQ85_001149 [[Candida] haemuloni]PVH18859.1 hypothetical protein CXQ85_001149 [[Candida] haemuloni]